MDGNINFLLPSALEAINFLQAIEITSGKAFRLFSEHRKSYILLYSSFSKWKKGNRLND